MLKKHAVAKFSSPSFLQVRKNEDPTMLKYMGILQRINKYGYLTTESQAGHKSGTNYERAYIAGFMLETLAEKFIKNMGIFTDKTAIYLPKCKNNTHLPASLDVPLTLNKKSGKVVVVVTHMSSALPDSVWELQRKQLNIDKSEKIVFIECWDPKWCRNASNYNGLFTDVLKMLKKSIL